MSKQSNAQFMTIGQAVELLSREFPDVSISSLRYLEREGLVSPERKPGGHRLYASEDLERVRVIKQWQADRIPLKEILRRLESLPSATRLPDIVKRITAHLLDEEIDPALVTLEDLEKVGTPLLTICERVLTPVLRNLGDDQGNHLIPVNVQLELDERLIRFLANATLAPKRHIGNPVVVAACPPWERHDMPLRMLSALLEERGASMHFIGAQVDRGFLIDANTRLNPDVILVSFTVTPNKEMGTKWIAALIESMNVEQVLMIGGMGSLGFHHIESDGVYVVGTESYSAMIERVMSRARSVSG